jgi:hypothetical protein
MSKFGAGFVVLGTVFVCAATAFAQDFRGTPSRGSHAHPMPLGSAPSTFLTAERLKPVSGAGSPFLVLGAGRFSAETSVQRRKRPHRHKCFQRQKFDSHLSPGTRRIHVDKGGAKRRDWVYESAPGAPTRLALRTNAGRVVVDLGRMRARRLQRGTFLLCPIFT